MTDRLDAAVTELAEQLVNHVVPLFSVPPGKRPELIGTGLLVRGKSRLFLVSAWKVPIAVEQLVPRKIPRESHHYLVVGFPKSRSRADPSKMQLRVEPHGFRVVSSPESSYKAVGLREDSHIVMNLDIGKMHFPDGSIRPIPDPHGMSGSPLWLLFDEVGANDSAKTPVLGVLIEHHKQAKLLVATDIGIVLELIQKLDK